MQFILFTTLWLLMLGATEFVSAEVILYRYENYTGEYSIDETTRNLKELKRTMHTACNGGGRAERLVPCTRAVSVNDDFRAIRITGSTVVEVYEHKDFQGKMLRFRAPGGVFPASFWDKASSIAIFHQ